MMPPPARKRCFVICPLGDEKSEPRQRTNRVWSRIIVPAAVACGYEEANIERSDLIHKPGIITTQIVDRLVEADLVIADLTDHNPNVFYELAIRHFVRKPVVILILRGQPIPFDVSPNRVIHYDLNDWDSPAECEKALIGHIKEAPTDGMLDNPVSAALTAKYLQRQSGTDKQLLVEVVQAIAGLGDRITNAEQTVSFYGSLINPFQPGTFSNPMLSPGLAGNYLKLNSLGSGTFSTIEPPDDSGKRQ
jgi:hypothetical protein